MMKKSMQVCLGNQILTAFSDGSFTFPPTIPNGSLKAAVF